MFCRQQQSQERLETLHSAAVVINRMHLDIYNTMVVEQLEHQLITQDPHLCLLGNATTG
jgi:hypothetical protein